MAKNVKRLIAPWAHKALRPIVRDPEDREAMLARVDLAAEARFKPELPQLATPPGVSVPEFVGTQAQKGSGAPFNPAAKQPSPGAKGWN